MKLKEAFRYQNTLARLISNAESFLLCRDNVTIINENHKKSVANPDATDEKKEICNREIEIEPNKVINLLYDLVQEKNAVSEAISIAKRNCKEDIDLIVEKNKVLQRLSVVYSSLANIKGSERIKECKAYKFNAEGNQTPYVYEVEEVTTIDYDRDMVRKLQKKLDKETNEASLEVESLQLSIEVEHTPKYEISTYFEDLIENLQS